MSRALTTADRSRLAALAIARDVEHAATYGTPLPDRRAFARLAAVRVATLAAIALALIVLGMVGRADIAAECTAILSAGPSDAVDAVTCADMFPDIAARYVD